MSCLIKRLEFITLLGGAAAAWPLAARAQQAALMACYAMPAISLYRECADRQQEPGLTLRGAAPTRPLK